MTNSGLPAIELDKMMLVSDAISTLQIEDYLKEKGLSTTVNAFKESASNMAVLVAAHEYSNQQLADICAELKHCWVHLVSSGTEYKGLRNLDAVNLVTRTWKAHSKPLAEYALAALLETEWRNRYHWSKTEPWSDEIGLYGKSALVFGFGSVGENIATILHSLGVNVSIVHKNKKKFYDDGFSHISLCDLQQEYDYFISALPETPGTFHLINEQVLSHLKKGGHLINVGRGTNISMDAIHHAVEERSIWATLDVTDPEPLPKNHPLLHKARVRISDHTAWQTGLSDLCFLEDWIEIRSLLKINKPPPDGAVVNRHLLSVDGN